MRASAFFPVFALGLALSSQIHAADCLSSDRPAEIEGLLALEAFPGPPNFQSIAKGDKPETVLVLKLDTPVCVDASADEMSDAVQDVRTIQLALRGPEQFALFKKQVGKRVRLSGKVFAAISGHHHTPVLLEEVTAAPLP